MGRFDTSLAKVFGLHDRIADLHVALEQIFPVAVFNGDALWLYQPEVSAHAHRDVDTVQPPFPLPNGVMAAFRLEEPAAVVTERVFDSLEGYIAVFHEFIHCYQHTTCEERLKSRLEGDLSRQAKLRQRLGKLEYEYLVWQEWKEGFARWPENQICGRLGLLPNQYGNEPPYSRVSFYAGGAILIEHLTSLGQGISNDLEALFGQIRGYSR